MTTASIDGIMAVLADIVEYPPYFHSIAWSPRPSSEKRHGIVTVKLLMRFCASFCSRTVGSIDKKQCFDAAID